MTTPHAEAMPAILRAASNGRASGSGIRLYVPVALTQEFNLAAGDYYRATRTGHGSIRLTRHVMQIERTRLAGSEHEPAGARIQLHLLISDARLIEDVLVAAANKGVERSRLAHLAKQIRRRLKANGHKAPRRSNALEVVP